MVRARSWKKTYTSTEVTLIGVVDVGTAVHAFQVRDTALYHWVSDSQLG